MRLNVFRSGVFHLLFTLIFVLFHSQASKADTYSDFYFAAKQYISPDFFQRAEYLSDRFGSPFVFLDRPIRAHDVIGIATTLGRNTYRDESVEEWVFELVDLAIQVVHIRTLLRERGITTSAWREQLIAYEDVQLNRVRQGLPLDPLTNIAPGVANPNDVVSSVVYYSEDYECERNGSHRHRSIERHTCTPLELARRNQQALLEVVQSERISDAEAIFAEIFFSSFDYVFERGDATLAFLIWEPSCECGNGSFTIQIALPRDDQSIQISSEFAVRVCEFQNSNPVDELSDCTGTHTLGTGQSVYLSGNYRYQIIDPFGEPGAITAIQLQGADVDGRTLQFTSSGHQIVE